MAVVRSPFSSSSNDKGPWADDSLNDFLRDKESDSGARRAPKLSDLKSQKSTRDQEKAELDKAVNTGLQKIARSNLYNQRTSTEPAKILKQAAAGRDVGGGLWKKLTSVAFAPVKGIGAVLEGGQRASNWIQSGVKELADATRLATVGGINVISPFGDVKTDARPSWGDFVKQGQEENFKFQPTGIKFIDGPLDFTVDVLGDPVTYFGVGAVNYLGQAGRVVLATKFGTKAMLAKYPEMASKLDDVVRYGVSAVPKHIREAEGIKHGLRYAGRVIPKTEKLADAIVGKYGLIALPRTKAGDLIARSTYATYARHALTPKSIKPFIEAGVGRAFGVTSEKIIPLLADNTAKRYAKGAVAMAYQKNIAGVKQLLNNIKDAGELDNVARLLENPVDYASATPIQRQFADEYKQWQDGIVREVNEIYTKFGVDFGARVKGINVIDDFIHHRLTNEAKQFIYAKNGGLRKGLFKEADLSAEELAGVTGAARHRKYRGQIKDDQGNIIKRGEEFMGVELETGTIDEMNKIFSEVSGLGPDVKFFETDIASIADSYAYSMAKARGREAYVRRAMDFGDDAIKVIGQRVKMDPELVERLSVVHKAVIAQRNALINKVARGRDKVRGNAEQVLARMERIIAGKEEGVKATRKEIDKLRKEIQRVETLMVDALDVAAGRQASERAMFFEMHKGLMEEIAMMKTALELDETEVYAVTKNLQQIYMATFPNAKRIPKDPTVLYEKIMGAKGISKPRELFDLNKRRAALQSQYEEMVAQGADPNVVQQLLDEDKILVQHIDASSKMGDVRVRADYTEDGYLFGTFDDLSEQPFDPAAGEQTPFRVLNSKIIAPDANEFDPDASAIYRETFKNDPNSVAVHAIPTEDLVDMRDPDGYYWFFSPENEVHLAVGQALDRAGLDGTTFVDEYANLLREGGVDPFIEDQYPELHSLMIMLYNADTIDFPEGVVPDEVLGAVFDEIRENFQIIAASRAIPDSDVVGNQMFDDMLGYMTQLGRGEGEQVGWIMPSRVLYGADNPDAVGSYSVLIPNDYSYSKGVPIEELMGNPTSKVTPLGEQGTFVRSVLDKDYETASLEAHQRFAEVTGRLADAENVRVQAEETARQIKELGINIRTEKGQATKRLKAAQKQMERFNSTGKIRVSLDGGKTYKDATPDEVRSVLARKEKKIDVEYQKLQSRLDRIMEKETGAYRRKVTTMEERLPTLFDKVRAFNRWNDETGQVYRKDVDAMRTVLAEEPPTGIAGQESRAWTSRVQRTMESLQSIQDPNLALAYERLTMQLHADEAQLALLEYFQLPSISEDLAFAKKGVLGKAVDDIQRGWEKIENLGVQVPDELYDLWRPQLEKLIAQGAKGPIYKALREFYNWNVRFFKTYALATLGTGVRNAMSATFMNHVAGVETTNMLDGIKAAFAYMRNQGVDWVDDLGLDGAEKMLYLKAWEATEVTGHGMVDELSSLTKKGGFAERVVNNAYTRFFDGMHRNVERAVRMPMALDSLRKGYSFDETVARITRYHFDYSDLSSFDEASKRLVPFWIWTTRNIPLQMVEMWARPSAYATYEKIQEQNPVNPDLIMPSWISEMGPIGIGANFVLTPDLPQVRLRQAMEQLINPQRAIGQMLPLVKLPVELMLADKQLALDIPFSDKYEEAKGADKAVAFFGELLSKVGIDGVGRRNPETGKLEIGQKAQYAMGSAVPPLAQAQRLTGGFIGGKASYSDRMLSSWMTTLGIPAREVTESMERSELIRRQFNVSDALKDMVKKGLIEKER